MASVNPFDFFEHIYCIHLPTSTDRIDLVRKEFQKLEILDRVDFIHATPPNKDNLRVGGNLYYPQGQIGVKLSHLKALHDAMDYNYENVLIFEDDVMFPNYNSEKLRVATKELPEVWDMLYLGGEPIERTDRQSPSLVQVNKFLCCHAYAVHRDSMGEICDLIVDNLTNSGLDGGIYCEYTPYKRAYCVYPPICIQRPNYSIITQRDADYSPELNAAWRDFKPEEP
jgi:GR25 family glycosyltransferase involved in LPS biosynthesis